MVKAVVGRMIFRKVEMSELHGDSSPLPPPSLPPPAVDLWLAPDIYMRTTTHLDDEPNMKKAVLDLVDEIILKRQSGCITYGILFSFFHCLVVRVDPDNGFKSTATLQFLPDFHGTPSDPATPGIIAIARLAYHCYTAVMGRDVANTLPPNHFLNEVPLDVLEHIAEKLDPADLRSFRSATPLFEPATDALLRYPYVGDYRLLNIGQALPVPPKISRSRSGSDVIIFKTFSAVVPSNGEFVPELPVGIYGGPSQAFFSIPCGEVRREIPYGEVEPNTDSD
ncbi:hypothetical protein FB451DRAFT_198888 [Mycena latifolia]|nr:hypothetical protein FB451DRAFT_198888 [Mycena latifolia]